MRSGIGGTINDLLENVETNLRVGRFERCKRIIRKIAHFAHNPDYVIYVHHKFLDARLDSMSVAQQTSQETPKDIFDDMQDWFNTEIVAKRVQLDPRILVTMLRGALQALRPSDKRERIIRDIYSLAVDHGEDTVDAVINSEQYTDEDLWALVEILPEFAAEDLGLHDADNVTRDHESDEHRTSSTQEYSSPPSDTPDTLPDNSSDLPHVLEMDQRGFGLMSLQAALASAAPALNSASANESSRKPLSPRERQELIEDAASTAAISRWQSEDKHLRDMGIHSNLDSGRPLGALMWQWYSALLPALEEELELCRQALDKIEDGTHARDDRLVYASHLESVPLTQVAATTILTVMGSIVSGRDKDDVPTTDMKLHGISTKLGKMMEQEANLNAHQKATMKAGWKLRTPQKMHRPRTLNVPAELSWPLNVRAKIGAMLVSKLIETAKITVSRPHPRTKEICTQEQPAFVYKLYYEHGRKSGVLSPCTDLIKQLTWEPVGHLIAKRLPMVIEPEPWTGFSQGGYITQPTTFIRLAATDKIPRSYAGTAIARGDLSQVFSALDTLGKVPWTINKEVLQVQIEAWNSGKQIANFAPLKPEHEVLEKPADGDMAAVRAWKTQHQAQQNQISAFHSQRCFQNFQLEIARSFANDKMYFPHNIDFRGRAYPIPPYLNHMGADNARGLMKFATGKELGVAGLRWLKIHLANVFGYDKASLQEREDFVMEHLPDIYDSATNPLDGNRWWLKSEDAWQTLAACYELKAALDSPDPTKFVSTLPIHQDGTCNGLQHYAALGGDPVGARQVNLEPGDRPSDVYSAVADAVKAEVEEEFNKGHPIAKILHGKITRKVVKQPVMTNVYGVTFFGARQQVRKQLQDLFPDNKRNDAINHMHIAEYIVKKIFKSLGEMFNGAQAIQRWLGECADRISTCVTKEQIEELRREAESDVPPPIPETYRWKERKAGVKKAGDRKPGPKPKAPAPESLYKISQTKQLFRSSVIWTTPLRLPVVQPYRANKRKMITTVMSRLSLVEPSLVDPISKTKQISGFAPNFIHSLDATHMMLSANKCSEAGITFASVHDSFWTHPCDIENMSRILRDAFVDMHSEDIVDRLRHEFVARYQGAMFLATLDASSPVGQKISLYQQVKDQRSDKQASTQSWQVRELLLETERQELLRSEDPEKRMRGENMITAASIFAAEKDAEQALVVPAEVTDAMLGDMSGGENVKLSGSSVTDPDLDGEEMVGDTIVNGAKVNHEVPAEDTFNSAKDSEADFIKQINGKKKKGKGRPMSGSKTPRSMFIWLPLKFPDKPEKGSFDVRRLKDSTYFFH